MIFGGIPTPIDPPPGPPPGEATVQQSVITCLDCGFWEDQNRPSTDMSNWGHLYEKGSLRVLGNLCDICVAKREAARAPAAA
jgi:hypothetical protein